MEIKRYDFGRDFQTAILLAIIKDANFLREYRETISPEYFNDECYRVICNNTLELFDKHDENPSIEAIEESLNVDENGESLKDALSYVLSKQIDGFKAIKDKAISFAKTQAINKAVEEAKELSLLGKFDDVKTLFDNALIVGSNEDNGYKYRNDVVERLASYDEVEPSIPTGMGKIDEALEGGLHRKEMGLIIAPPSGGKTTFLVSIGKHALINGYNVVHYTLELRRKRVARRYDMSIAEMTKEDLRRMKRSAALKIHNDIEGDLIIQDYPASSVNCNILRNHLNRIRNSGLDIGLIIVDYDDLINPTRNYSESIGDVKRLYKELRSLSFEFNCGLWTATQTNKKIFEMQKGEVIGGREATGSLEGKFGTPDVIISGNQTYDEYRSGFIRVHLAKNREGTAKIIETYGIDYRRMLIKEV